jgi:hypothetical protein
MSPYISPVRPPKTTLNSAAQNLDDVWAVGACKYMYWLKITQPFTEIACRVLQFGLKQAGTVSCLYLPDGPCWLFDRRETSLLLAETWSKTLDLPILKQSMHILQVGSFASRTCKKGSRRSHSLSTSLLHLHSHSFPVIPLVFS